MRCIDTLCATSWNGSTCPRRGTAPLTETSHDKPFMLIGVHSPRNAEFLLWWTTAIQKMFRKVVEFMTAMLNRKIFVQYMGEGTVDMEFTESESNTKVPGGNECKRTTCWRR